MRTRLETARGGRGRPALGGALPRMVLSSLTLALLLVPVPGVAGTVEGGRYVPGTGVVAIWCDDDDHTLVPHDRSQDEIQDGPDRWLFSGDPQCVGADAANTWHASQGGARRATGTGGFAWFPTLDDDGASFLGWTDDALFGAEAHLQLSQRITDGSQSTEGCGPQTLTLKVAYEFWGMKTKMEPVWAFFRPLGVDDDLRLCGATTGEVTAAYG